MIICDSCNSLGKIERAAGPFKVTTGRTGKDTEGENYAEIHLCWECKKDFDKMASALVHRIMRKGTDAVLTAIYRD